MGTDVKKLLRELPPKLPSIVSTDIADKTVEIWTVSNEVIMQGVSMCMCVRACVRVCVRVCMHVCVYTACV